jgi:hypothetical protein
METSTTLADGVILAAINDDLYAKKWKQLLLCLLIAIP